MYLSCTPLMHLSLLDLMTFTEDMFPLILTVLGAYWSHILSLLDLMTPYKDMLSRY